MPVPEKQRERERAHRLEINALRETLHTAAASSSPQFPLDEAELKAPAIAETVAARGAREWWRKQKNHESNGDSAS